MDFQSVVYQAKTLANNTITNYVNSQIIDAFSAYDSNLTSLMYHGTKIYPKIFNVIAPSNRLLLLAITYSNSMESIYYHIADENGTIIKSCDSMSTSTETLIKKIKKDIKTL